MMPIWPSPVQRSGMMRSMSWWDWQYMILQQQCTRSMHNVDHGVYMFFYSSWTHWVIHPRPVFKHPNTTVTTITIKMQLQQIMLHRTSALTTTYRTRQCGYNSTLSSRLRFATMQISFLSICIIENIRKREVCNQARQRTARRILNIVSSTPSFCL